MPYFSFSFQEWSYLAVTLWQVLSIIDSSHHVLNDLPTSDTFKFKIKQKEAQKRESFGPFNQKILVDIPFIGISLMNSYPEVCKNVSNFYIAAETIQLHGSVLIFLCFYYVVGVALSLCKEFKNWSYSECWSTKVLLAYLILANW